jgi:hypothetical protein
VSIFRTEIVSIIHVHPGSRKTQSTNPNASPVKYCSNRCRNNKPGRLERQIEDAFVSLLNGLDNVSLQGQDSVTAPKKDKSIKKVKGDPRILVPCTAVETVMFGTRYDPEKDSGRKKNRAKRGVPDSIEWKSVDMEDDPETEGTSFVPRRADEDQDLDGDVLARMSIRSGTRIRPSQEISEVNGGVGGEKGRAERIQETEEMLQKRREGEQKAKEREMVRCAARRGVAFGFLDTGAVGDEQKERRKCEAVMLGKVVESSFAKGDWSIRWRE